MTGTCTHEGTRGAFAGPGRFCCVCFSPYDRHCLAGYLLLGCQRTIWPWSSPSVAHSTQASDATGPRTSPGPGHACRCHMWGLPAAPRAGNSPSCHLGPPEGRIPMAPEFMAVFILSKARGNKPRRKGRNRINDKIINFKKMVGTSLATKS